MSAWDLTTSRPNIDLLDGEFKPLTLREIFFNTIMKVQTGWNGPLKDALIYIDPKKVNYVRT